ncbi:phosphatase [Candidatus Dependentiae bacterium]|nr:phosphatase [Candidatus Dependentiae bacterium]
MKIYADLHTHTIASGHAYATIEEMARCASEKKLNYIGITDHGPSLIAAPNELYFKCALLCPPKIYGVEIIFGCEANIIDYDGSIDLSEDTARRLDILLAGFHNYTPYIPGSEKENTAALLKTVKRYKNIDIIAHPGNPAFKINYEDTIKCLNDYNVLIEINNRSFLPDQLSARKGSSSNCREIMRLCEKYNVRVVVSSDAHNQYQVGCFQYALDVLAEEKFPEKLILNSNLEKLSEYLGSIHSDKVPKEVLF